MARITKETGFSFSSLSGAGFLNFEVDILRFSAIFVKQIDAPRSAETNFEIRDVLSLRKIWKKKIGNGYVCQFIRFSEGCDGNFCCFGTRHNALPF